MADINYPHEYLPMPLQDGYGFQPVSPLLRTKLVSGRSRQRRLYTSTPTESSVTWLFTTDGQAQAFEAWFRDAIGDGVSWFMMKLQTPVGVKLYKCRFTDSYQGPFLVPPFYWQYSATLELWERPIPPVGWGNFPEFLTGSSIIDIAINRGWPEA